MEIDALLGKIYTVAYRLTGQDEAASDLALAAITSTAREFGWQSRKPVPPEMLPASIKEVHRLFLAGRAWYSNREAGLTACWTIACGMRD